MPEELSPNPLPEEPEQDFPNHDSWATLDQDGAHIASRPTEEQISEAIYGRARRPLTKKEQRLLEQQISNLLGRNTIPPNSIRDELQKYRR